MDEGHYFFIGFMWVFAGLSMFLIAWLGGVRKILIQADLDMKNLANAILNRPEGHDASIIDLALKAAIDR